MVEAARIVEEGIADVEDVDKACRLGFNHAHGPARRPPTSSGLDVLEQVGRQPPRQLRRPLPAAAVVRALVNAGHLGRKTGRGFREYGESR